MEADVGCPGRLEGVAVAGTEAACVVAGLGNVATAGSAVCWPVIAALAAAAPEAMSSKVSK